MTVPAANLTNWQRGKIVRDVILFVLIAFM
jgi:hypothetical protein